LTETEGDKAYDLSGNGNHGTVNGAIQGSTGRGGLSAYSFDGDNDHVKISSSSETDSMPAAGNGLPVSFSVWFRQSVGGGGRIYSESQSGTMDILSISHNQVYIRDSSDPGTTVDINENLEGEWHHIVGVFQDSRLLGYLDGELIGLTSHSRSPTVDNSYIGKLEYTQTLSHFDGQIASVRVYNRVLTPGEAKELYRQGSEDLHKKSLSDGSDPGAVSRWKLNDSSDASTAIDAWGGNDGTINGAAYTDDSVRNSGKSLRFNGSDYVSTPFNPNWGSNQSFTVSVWLCLDDTSNRYYIVSKNNGTGDGFLVSSYNGDFRWNVGDGSNYTKILSSNNLSWNHIVGIRDDSAGEAKLYVNGEFVGSKSVADYVTDNDQLVLGAYNADNSTYAYEGKVDDFRIFDRALSSWEVFELYRWGSLGRDMRKELVNKRGGN
jgi:hypothetical protein